jgi:hypothetical protein
VKINEKKRRKAKLSQRVNCDVYTVRHKKRKGPNKKKIEFTKPEGFKMKLSSNDRCVCFMEDIVKKTRPIKKCYPVKK